MADMHRKAMHYQGSKAELRNHLGATVRDLLDRLSLLRAQGWGLRGLLASEGISLARPLRPPSL